MNYLEDLKDKVNNLDILYIGCTNSEIETIEKELIHPLTFPKCYKEFLLLFGKDMDRKPGKSRGYLVGNAVFISDLEMNNNEDGLRGLLIEDKSTLKLHEKAFIFYGSQGILYAYFNLDEGDNPPVYGYAEGFEGDNFPEIAVSLSSFYERYLENDNTLFEEVIPN